MARYVCRLRTTLQYVSDLYLQVPQYVTKVVRYIPWGRIIITGLVIQTLLIFLISA